MATISPLSLKIKLVSGYWPNSQTFYAVKQTAANFVLSGADKTNRSAATFIIDSISGGYFTLGGTTEAVDTFTLAQLNGKDPAGVYFVATSSSVSITLHALGGGGLSSNTISPQPILKQAPPQAPVINLGSLLVDEGDMAILNNSMLSADDPSDESITFKIVKVTGGRFVTLTWVDKTDEAGQPILVDGLPVPEARILASVTSFSQADITASHIGFVHDGSTLAPTSSLTAHRGTLKSAPANLSWIVGQADDLTDVGVSPLTLTYTLDKISGKYLGTPVTLNKKIKLSDEDSATVDAVYTVKEIAGVTLLLKTVQDKVTTYSPITSFTQGDMANVFVKILDRDPLSLEAREQPLLKLTASINQGFDDDVEFVLPLRYVSPVANKLNAAPEMEAATLQVKDAGLVLLKPEDFSASDEDDASPLLTYYVSSLVGCRFLLNDITPVTNFTQAEVEAGAISFEHTLPGSTPTFKIQAKDELGKTSTLISGLVNVIFPDVTAYTPFPLPISEGGELVLSTIKGGNLLVVGPKNSLASVVFRSEVRDHVEILVGKGAAAELRDTFTYAELKQGLVRLRHDGDELPPVLKLRVDDGEGVGTLVELPFNYTEINDAPVLNWARIAVAAGKTVTVTSSMISGFDPEMRAMRIDHDLPFSNSGDRSFSFTDFKLAEGSTQIIEIMSLPSDGDLLFNSAPVSVGQIISAKNLASISYNRDQEADSSTVHLGYRIKNEMDNYLKFVISGAKNGKFVVGDQTVTEFTQADIKAGLVSFTHTGKAGTDGTFTIKAVDANIKPLSSAPVTVSTITPMTAIVAGDAIQLKTGIDPNLPPQGMSGNNEFTIAWGFKGEFLGQIFDAAGGQQSGIYKVSTPSNNESRDNINLEKLSTGQSLASWINTEFVIINQRTGEGEHHSTIQIQRFSESGGKLGSVVDVSNLVEASFNSVNSGALINGGWITAWTDERGALSFQRFSSSGAKAGTPVHVASGAKSHGEINLVGLSDGGFMVIWSDARQSDVWKAAKFDANGVKVVDTWTMLQYANSDIDVAALSTGGYLVAMESYSELLVQAFDNSGTPIDANRDGNPDTKVIDSSANAYYEKFDLQPLANGGYAVAWEQTNLDSGLHVIKTRAYSAQGLAIGDVMNIAPIVNGIQQDATAPELVSMGDSGFGIVFESWSAASTKPESSVWMQGFIWEGVVP